MYIYRGDGLQLTDKADPFRVRRTRAAKAYLQGLREALDCGAPLEEPKYPGIPMVFGELGRIGESGEMMSLQEGKRMAEALADAEAKRAEVRRMEPLWLYRRALFRQLIDMYGRRKPRAASELRQMATEIVGDPQVVAALMEGLTEKRALKDDPIPETKPIPEPSKSGSWWRFLLSALPPLAAVIVIAILLFRRTRRGAKRP